MSDLADLPLAHSYPAVADSVPRARRALARLASACGAAAEQSDAVRLAVSEAMTGAVLRAAGARRRISVSAAVAAGQLAVSIADDGPGGGPLPPAACGTSASLRLALIAHHADGLAIARQPAGGTNLQMRFGLRGVSPRR
ncbi:MAG: ATP-binding protein [Solirubrobacterales bacterium]|nr:ATP-binding protein [Solirubrobacterales bacterium]MBV9717469.1 ATP-binding protein [Solirubrobacterales bacterium]